MPTATSMGYPRPRALLVVNGGNLMFLSLIRDAEPEPPEPAHFVRSQSRSRIRWNILLGAGVGAGIVFFLKIEPEPELYQICTTSHPRSWNWYIAWSRSRGRSRRNILLGARARIVFRSLSPEPSQICTAPHPWFLL